MLIEIEFNLKLPVMGFIVLFRWYEKLHDVILGEKGTSQDSHDLHNRTPEFEVVFDNADETVCDNGDMYLDTHRIFTCPPKKI